MTLDATQTLPSVNLRVSDLANALTTRPTPEDRRWMTSSLSELAEYIVEQHHAYAKSELPRLAALAAKVHLRHGHMYPELNQIRELVEAMSSEVGSHMLKEEQILFPRLKIVEEAAQTGVMPPPAFFGSLLNPIRHMLGDHDDTGELLHSIRALTHNYTLPDGACMSYQALYQGLSDVERDLHQHIHLENDILFPRALEFEKAH
jgi:regulator of cell morphogenesis and NO signaling